MNLAVRGDVMTIKYRNGGRDVFTRITGGRDIAAGE